MPRDPTVEPAALAVVTCIKEPTRETQTCFPIVTKAIGVYLVCTAIPMAVSYGTALAVWYAQMGQLTFVFPPGLEALGRFAIGLYLLFGGKWLVDLCIPSNRPYCPECGYDLSHTASIARCPECGVAVPTEIASHTTSAREVASSN